MFWTDEKVATLKDLWEQGYSGSLIAERIGCTRNAILGKVFRLQLEQRIERQHPSISKPRVVPQQRPRRTTGFALERPRLIRRTFLKRCTAPKTSAAYRNHLPIMPEMSKSELRAMLRAAVENTVSL